MRKFILLLIIFFCTINTGLAETLLQGGVVYTVEAARKLAFDGLDLKLDKQAIKPYLYDENNEENRKAIKDNTQPKGRYIMGFETAKNLVKGYVVVYDDKPQYAYYYSNGGYLVAIDVDNKQKDGIYPYKIGKYSALTGNLISIALYVSEDEQFAYTKNGKLKAHWIGDTGYNANGKPIAKRKVLDEIPSD